MNYLTIQGPALSLTVCLAGMEIWSSRKCEKPLEFTGIYGVLCVVFSKHCKYKLFLLERSNTLQISASWAAACVKTLAAFCWSRCPKVLNCNYFRLFGNLLYEDTSMCAAAQYADIAKS